MEKTTHPATAEVVAEMRKDEPVQETGAQAFTRNSATAAEVVRGYIKGIYGDKAGFILITMSDYGLSMNTNAPTEIADSALRACLSTGMKELK